MFGFPPAAMVGHNRRRKKVRHFWIRNFRWARDRGVETRKVGRVGFTHEYTRLIQNIRRQSVLVQRCLFGVWLFYRLRARKYQMLRFERNFIQLQIPTPICDRTFVAEV